MNFGAHSRLNELFECFLIYFLTWGNGVGGKERKSLLRWESIAPSSNFDRHSSGRAKVDGHHKSSCFFFIFFTFALTYPMFFLLTFTKWWKFGFREGVEPFFEKTRNTQFQKQQNTKRAETVELLAIILVLCKLLTPSMVRERSIWWRFVSNLPF